MNNLEKKPLIDESKLNHNYYFQSLFMEACNAKVLTQTEIERIQIEVVELMTKEVERYTNDESSSVKIEKAQELLLSITYCLSFFMKSTTDMTQKLDMLKTEKISTLFFKGMEGVSACSKRAEQLLHEIQKSDLKLDNIAYQDTLYQGIAEFFHDYNIEFGAFETSVSIDYPLFYTITDLTGVEYISEYIRRLSLEHSYLLHYSAQDINELMKSFDPEAEHMLINIYELVLTNALGRAILGHNTTQLNISKDELQWLQSSLEKLSTEELTKKFTIAFDDITKELELEEEVVRYTLAAIPEITVRLKHNLETNTLDRIFIIYAETIIEDEFFEDGLPMEDEELRDLIEKLSDISITADKIVLMKDTVRSRVDFIELLDECFYEDEYEEVFASLNEQEKEVLRKSILLEAGLGRYEEYEPEKDWQKILFR